MQFNSNVMSSRLTYKVCFCFQRRFRVAAAEAPADVKAIFSAYAANNGFMSVEQLRRFLVEVQKEANATLDDAQALIDSVSLLNELKHLSLFHKRGLNLEGFFKYLFGDANPPVNPKIGVHHDMKAPLSHYFIYTGHNSYLTGNQLSSACSDIPIINALLRGVRVIELDIWPNSAKDNVEVLHGRTLTTPVKLIKCLRSIKEHAFTTSDYPVVITLEDHLTPYLQAKTAEMITRTFGDMLFAPGPECLCEFPSPESLKRKIMISTKPPKEYLQAKDEITSKKVKDPAKEEPRGIEIRALTSKVSRNKKIVEVPPLDEGTTVAVPMESLTVVDDLDEEGDEDDEYDKSDTNTATEFRHLIAIHAGKGKGGMQDWLRVEPNKARRLSLSEQELERAISTYTQDVVRFTQKNILRIYPKGIRFDSSNYNPLIGWMHGAQMVALNMQGYGRSLWLMHGMFRANGGCGYVKKPDFLLKAGDEVFDPKVTLPVKMTLVVTVYMGEGWFYDFHHTYFDNYSPPDFYAKVGIAGVPADVVMKRTKTIDDNWIPNWDEVFVFPLTVPELALLRVQVHEHDQSEKDDFAGQTCLPVPELRQGIRAVPLHTQKGERYKSVKLLMRFEIV